MPDNSMIDDVLTRVYNGEYNTKEDLRMAIKLLLNANGTNLYEAKKNAKELVEYSTVKRTIDGTEYIPIETVLDIIESI